VTVTDLFSALSLPFIQQVSAAICERTGASIYPIYNEALSQATCEQIRKSEISLEDLIVHAEASHESFQRFASALVLFSQGAPIEQAYSAMDSDLPAAWLPAKTMGLSKDFVFPHMIIYYFLSKSSENLEGYLKATRNPNPKQLAKKYAEIFSRAKN
jgi:hypothetical protein